MNWNLQVTIMEMEVSHHNAMPALLWQKKISIYCGIYIHNCFEIDFNNNQNIWSNRPTHNRCM